MILVRPEQKHCRVVPLHARLSDGPALLAAAVQAACAAKAPRRTVAAVAAAVVASLLRQDAAAAAPLIPRTAEPDCAPSSMDAAGDEQRLKLREARRAKRKLKRQRRQAAQAPVESTVVATMVAPPSNNAEPASTWGDTFRRTTVETSIDDAKLMSDGSLGKRKLDDTPAIGTAQASEPLRYPPGSWQLADDGRTLKPKLQVELPDNFMARPHPYPVATTAMRRGRRGNATDRPTE